MINDNINNVPDNTVAVFPISGMPYERLNNIIFKPERSREWFTPHFYNCLPLSVANQYGFLVASEFDFAVHWNGGNEPTDLWFEFPDGVENIKDLYPGVRSHFGNGIFTLEIPYVFRTPPGVNLMVIAPTNYILPNITNLAGIVEADNLRFTFTINLRMQIPGVAVYIQKGTPLATILPIPRYFAETFDLVNASEIFDKTIVDEEITAFQDTYNNRQTDHYDGKNNKQYFKGTDCYGNKFNDHQGTSMQKIVK